jgi:hypothetical protein
MRGEHFNLPFSEEDFRRRMKCSSGNTRVTKIEALEAVEEVAKGISPSGFVFHISRCGSTLLRHFLGEVRGSLVVSEPPFMSEALSDEPAATVRRRVQGGIKALGRSYTGLESRFFIKFQSPHTGKLDVFISCFPDVPTLYLYRDPMEVFQKVVLGGGSGWLAMKSNADRAAQFVGLDPALINTMSLDEYAARVIGRHYEIAAEQSPRGLALLNYRNLTRPKCIRKVLDFFGLNVSDEEFERVLALRGKNAKLPRKDYSERRMNELSTRQRDLVETWATVPYERLEGLDRAL